MWILIFISYVNGVPQSPSYLGSYNTEASCAAVARKTAESVHFVNYRWLCVDQDGNG